MDGMEAICKEHEKMLKKHKYSVEKTNSNLATLQRLMTTVKEGLKVDTQPSIGKKLEALTKNVKEMASLLSEEQKELHGALNKYGKGIEKKFNKDIGIGSRTHVFEGKEDLIYKTISMHFVRQGWFDLAHEFTKEAKIDIGEELTHQFMEMYHILTGLRQKDLGLALRWAYLKRSELQDHSSNLEFKLHSINFVQILEKGDSMAAIEYAKHHFPYFSKRHLSDIQKLMGCLLYAGNLNSSPYKAILNRSSWNEIEQLFTSVFCLLMGLSADCPLTTSIMVGAIALPIIIKMTMIMKEKKTEWSQEDELPVEIHLPYSLRFHSVFACPVSKEQGTEENPPMMMPCGHVLCKESINRLSKGSSTARFKCPYCPSESTSAQALRIYF